MRSFHYNTRRSFHALIAAILWLCPAQAWTSLSSTRRHHTQHHHTCARSAVTVDYDTISTSTTPRKSLLEKSAGVIYRKSVFTNEELATIRREIQKHKNRMQDECASSIAQHRLGTALDLDSPVVDILRSGSLKDLVEKVVGGPCELSTNLPVEVRAYARKGAGMAWHVDDVLYDPPQIEVIWTLENDSDCQTLWKENSSSNVLHSVETEPNSVILLLAGGAPHCVTHLKHGSRVILKFAFVKQGAVFLSGQHKNQFETKRKKRRKNHKSKRR